MIESTARAERVSLSSAATPAFTWEVTEKPVAVQMPFALIDRMEREVVENFRSLTSRGSEIGGILLGSAAPGNPTTVYIADYEVIPCDYSRGPLYRLSDADMSRVERAIEQRMGGGGMRVVGFFRSHTRKGLSLDSEDLTFLKARFRDPGHVVLLVRPFAAKVSTAGFFIWENGSMQGESSYLEFPFRSSQLSGARPAASTASEALVPPAAPSSPSVEPPPPAQPKPAARAQIVPIASRREIALPVPPVYTKETPAETKAEETQPAPAAVVAPPASPAPPEETRKAVEIAKVEPARQEPEKPKESAVPAAPEKEKAAAIQKPAEKQAAEKQAAAKQAAEEKKPGEEKKVAEEKKIAEMKVAAEKPPAVPSTAPKAEAAAGPKASPGRGRGLMIGVLAVAALLACTVLFLYPGVLRHSGHTATVPTEAPALSLRVERTGSDILLTWNRDSAAIQHAAHAVLTISDGDRHENYDMDLGQLRNGSIVYSPLTSDVSFHMEVSGQNNGATVSESVRVLRTRPSPMPDETQPAAETPPAKTNPKSAAPAGGAAPAEKAPAKEETGPVKSISPTRPFNSASLAQRLRPATPSDIPLPDAPAMNSNPVAPSTLPSIGGGPAAPSLPVPPPPVAAPAAPEKRAASAPPPTRAGGQIVQAEVIYSKQPDYPKLARQMGVKGTVEVLATIGVDGHVKAVKVEKGHPLLVKAATDAVMQWIYRPTLLNGTPVENDTHITLNFMGDR